MKFLAIIGGLLIFIIAKVIWVSWKSNPRKERYQMNGNKFIEKEQQNISKQDKELKEASAREQENHAEQLRKESDRSAVVQREAEQRAMEQRAREERDRQDRLRKESERKKSEQNKKYSVAGHGNDILTDVIRIAETSVKMLYEDSKYIIQSSREVLQKRADAKQLTEVECNKIISSYTNLKNQVEQLDKVNKNLETNKDKRVIDKYINSKSSLEKKISETLNIQKDKPKFFQSKKVPESTFRTKVQKGLSELGAKAKIATERLKVIQAEKKLVQGAKMPVNQSRTATRSKQQTQKPKARIR